MKKIQKKTIELLLRNDCMSKYENKIDKCTKKGTKLNFIAVKLYIENNLYIYHLTKNVRYSLILSDSFITFFT